MIKTDIQMGDLYRFFKGGTSMELFTLDTTANLLGKTTQTVRNMVKRGQLVAVYPNYGKKGRPNLMITASSCGDYIYNKNKRKAGN